MGSRYPRLLWAAAVVAGLAVSLSAGPPVDDAPALRSITGRLDAEVSTVLIEATAPVAYLTSQPDPFTVLVDLRHARAGTRTPDPGPMPAPVRAVTVAPALAPDGAPVARVTVALDRPAPHRVRASRNVILVEVERDHSPAAPAGRPALLQAPATVAGRGLATRLVAVRPVALSTGTAITLSGNGRLVASRVEETRDLPARVLLDFEGVAMGAVPAATLVNQDDIERVRVGTNSRDPLITRVVIDLARRLPYSVETVGEELRVLFARAAEAATALVASVAPAVSLPPSAPQASAAADAAAAAAAGAMAAAVPPATEPVAAAASQTAGGARVALLQGGAVGAQQAAPAAEQRFTGDPVTFDFQGADLRAVLRTFSEISGLNVVIDPTIQGTVDVSLKEVPWDQALDIILKANKLGYTVDGTIVRIAPLSVLADEEAQRRKLAEAQALAGELRVMTRALSYARAQDLIPIITKSALSQRGDVQVDQRTNTLIIRDLADRLDAAGELIRTLDSPQPQVEIEARIVQTSRDFARSLGVQWGFNGRAVPQLGNTTNLAFPNSIQAGGRLGTLQGPDGTSTAVDLAATAANNAVGIALGSINGAINLDVALSALERTGRGRLLSTPRVSTQNNVEAEITQGVQIQVQTLANQTVSVTFKDAALSLKVVPQITASSTVIMRITLENAAPDYSRSVQGIPPIDTQRAVTSVLVNDGETTVIGGIYTSREQLTEGRTPLLHRIPLLGWLFRRDETQEESRELLIFITPRITKG